MYYIFYRYWDISTTFHGDVPPHPFQDEEDMDMDSTHLEEPHLSIHVFDVGNMRGSNKTSQM